MTNQELKTPHLQIVINNTCRNLTRFSQICLVSSEFTLWWLETARVVSITSSSSILNSLVGMNLSSVSHAGTSLMQIEVFTRFHRAEQNSDIFLGPTGRYTFGPTIRVVVSFLLEIRNQE
ncbi:hypothetical protein TNCT_412051 [Trichonephila clavata]|uniref:Uncharacterized protein n=1 Tax=Trichonephila clavata TaxID=2740835 RepID=A0A8X6F856_TRICU|nr:hypothetical protein TNCT_412051 [Trichonephila clavata]